MNDLPPITALGRLRERWPIYWIRHGWEWGWTGNGWNILKLGKIRIWL